MIDLNVVLLDFVMRGGVPDAQLLVDTYVQSKANPSAYGVSAIFHPGFTLDQLAWAANQPHKQLHYATVAELRAALAPLGYEPVLVHTPSRTNADHATLGIARLGVKGVLQALPMDAAQALVAAFHQIVNPYRRKP
jgi:hypothetical protein